MPDSQSHAVSKVPNEDRRRPKSVALYSLLWGLCVACVVFALIALAANA